VKAEDFLIFKDRVFMVFLLLDLESECRTKSGRGHPQPFCEIMLYVSLFVNFFMGKSTPFLGTREIDLAVENGTLYPCAVIALRSIPAFVLSLFHFFLLWLFLENEFSC